MFYKTTHCTLSGLIAGVKLYPPIQMMLTILNQEGNVVHRLISNFKNFNSSAGWREAGVLAAFPLAFAKKMFGLNLKLTQKQQGQTKC